MNENERIDNREITSELKESFLDYAMSVIVSRALPDVRDGLKPVHRRILWDMWDSGLTHLAKFRKSANVIGQVLARYHPHGDMAVYDALVRMAQDFSLRYPLIVGQGNFGSVDGDSAAAYRYTEAKLSKIAEELLVDVEKETVDWQPNYDATRMEPKVLPARLPGLLLNGSIGIAVGMMTSIPPHNLNEVADAVLLLADNPDAEHDELMKCVKGPDFPTGGTIFDAKAISAAYATGRGKVTTQAKAEIVERKGGSKGALDIVITEIPYQVNKSELIVRIASLVEEKKLDGIRDLRDESNKDGLRIVVELKNDAPAQKVLNQLYRHTDLQKDFYLNMLALVDGLQPQVLSLKDILMAYLVYRKDVIRRRTEFDLARAKERAHILEGLSKALHDIDKVIATIKKSKDREDAQKNLIKTFAFSEAQTNAILDMRLQTLASLEREKIEAELKEKRALIKELELILKSPKKILEIIKADVHDLKEKYGDERRTKVVARGLTELTDEDLIPEEEAIVTLSSSGYVKRLPPGTFKTQNRGGKGLIGSDVGEEDFITHVFTTNTHDDLLFFTDRGRVFQTKAYDIPAASRTSKGKAIHNFLELSSDETISAIVSVKTKNKEAHQTHLVMITQDGVIKKTALADFANIRRTGIIAMNLGKGDLLKWVRLSGAGDQVILTTSGGQSIRFKESQIRSMGRTAAGVRALRLKKGDRVAGCDILTKEITEKGTNPRLLVVMEHGFAKQTPLKEYKIQNRGGSGIRTANITSKTGPIVAAYVVDRETEIFALSAKGQIIRTTLESVRTTGRSAQGVRIMNLNAGDRLAGVAVA